MGGGGVGGGGGGWGGETFIWGARGRHRNDLCTIKSEMGAMTGAHGVNGGMVPPIVTPMGVICLDRGAISALAIGTISSRYAPGRVVRYL